MVIINPNAPSVSNIGSNRADGQVQSTQVDARQSQNARQPQVAQQPTATQSATAANPGQANNNVPLLNNRDQAVSNAIRRDASSALEAPQRQDNESASRQTAEINVTQARAPAETLQRLADAAQARLDAGDNGENIGRAVSDVVSQAPERTEQVQAPAPQAAPTVDVDIDVEAAALPEAPAPQAQTSAQPATGSSGEQALVAESPEFVPPAPAFQVLQNAQQRLNDILLPDFANFIGLRASIPSATQAEQQVQDQVPSQPVDVEV